MAKSIDPLERVRRVWLPALRFVEECRLGLTGSLEGDRGDVDQRYTLKLAEYAAEYVGAREALRRDEEARRFVVRHDRLETGIDALNERFDAILSRWGWPTRGGREEWWTGFDQWLRFGATDEPTSVPVRWVKEADGGWEPRHDPDGYNIPTATRFGADHPRMRVDTAEGRGLLVVTEIDDDGGPTRGFLTDSDKPQIFT